ncbi:MAG: GAF domain-containing protein [Alistipes sp.]|nr:GAF domain-containing protein [Alistipes sp.]
MAEDFKIGTGSKEERYKLLFAQAESMLHDESDEVAAMANLAAMIHLSFGFWWTGFYRVVGNELVLGPFQGPVACTRIGYGRGVCGTAWREEQTIIVEDVEKFPGHIACSSLSRSEIVVPVWRNNRVCAVLDIDSEHLATFDYTDQLWLEKIVALLKK